MTRPAAGRPAKRAAKSTKPKARAQKKPAAKKRKTSSRSAADMSVVASVQREIEGLAVRDARIATSALAALALALAREMDGKNSATSKSMCAHRLAETLEKLESMAPPKQRQDAIDELASRRTTRRRRAAS